MSVNTGERRGVGKRLRFAILQRDNFTCQLCGARGTEGVPLELDHKVPYSLGGKTTEDNLWTLCKPCNGGKTNTPWEHVAEKIQPNSDDDPDEEFSEVVAPVEESPAVAEAPTPSVETTVPDPPPVAVAPCKSFKKRIPKPIWYVGVFIIASTIPLWLGAIARFIVVDLLAMTDAPMAVFCALAGWVIWSARIIDDMSRPL